MADNLIIRSIVNDNRITAQFTDKYLPRYARHGELFVVEGILYIYTDLDDSSHGRWFPLTDKKEIYTYDQPIDAQVWTIPIDFHTDNIQVIVYDDADKIFRGNFSIDIDAMQVKITFEEPSAGKAYIVINQAFDWVDKRFIVADRNFAVTEDESNPDAYYIEVDTEYLEILKNGNTTFKRNVDIDGELVVDGNATFNGDQTLNGNVNIAKNLSVGGTITVVNDLIAQMSAIISKDLHVLGNTVVDGNLTVKGAVTSIQTEEIKLDDNIITLNSNAIGTPFVNAGIEVFRGDEGSTTIIQWDESSDETNIPNNTRINGNLQLDGSLNIDGDLTIQGENVNINTSTLTVEDTIITINKGMTGAPTENAGLEIDRGDQGVLPLILFNETDDFVSIPVKQQDGAFLQDEVAGKVYTTSEINKERYRAINQETIINLRVETLENVVETKTTDLQNQITIEKNNRISNDINIQSQVDAEIVRATTTETTLRNDLDTEISDRQDGDDNLQTLITNEETSRIAGDALVTTAINTEKVRAEGVESTLQTQISNEVARARSVEGILSQLTTTNKTNLVNALNEEIARAKAEENNLFVTFSAESTTRENTFLALQTRIDDEVSARTSADTTLQSNIDSEKTTRISSDNTITTNLNNEIARATGSETTLQSNITNLTNNVETNYFNKTTLTTQSVLSDTTFGGNIVIQGNLTISGSTTTVNTEQMSVADNIITLNANVTTGTATQNAGLEVMRGDAGKTTIIQWNEAVGQVEIYENGGLTKVSSVDYVDGEVTAINSALSSLQAQISATSSSSTSNDTAVLNILNGTTPVENANKLTTARTIGLSGGVVGSTSFDGSTNVTIAVTVQDDLHNHIVSNIDGLQTALDGKQAAGIYNTVIGTDTNLNNDGASVVHEINVSSGVITSMTSRILTLANLGFTGDANANFYTHPTTSGYKHIPTGGTLGQILVWSEDGTAVWGNDTNTWRPISDSIATISSTTSASLTAVKAAYDLANHNHPYASTNGAVDESFSGKIITASQSIKAPIYYDSDNLTYFMDLSSTTTSLNAAGNIVTAGDVTAYSDMRLKTNILNIDSALDRVMRINGVTFNRVDLEDKETRHTGVIAQEVESVLPEAVCTNEDGFKTVAYGNMVGLLIEAIKEQQQQINDLKSELKSLKGN